MNKIFRIVSLIGVLCMFLVFGNMAWMFLSPMEQWESHTNLIMVFAISGFACLIIGSIGGSIASSYKAASINKKGLLAIATIKEVHTTGTEINDQPEIVLLVNFTTQKGEVIDAKMRQVFPLTQVASLQPGLQLPIKYDPLKPQAIALVKNANLGKLQEEFNQMQMNQGTLSEEVLEMVKKGIKTKAVITSLEPTGQIINGNSEIKLGLKVTRAEGTIFDVVVTKVIPQVALKELMIGKVINVAYLSENEEKIAIML